MVAAMLVLIGLATAAPARAGTYLMRSCNVPGERPASQGQWQWSFGGSFAALYKCPSGGGFGLTAGPSLPAGETGELYLVSRPSILIRRVRLWLVANLNSAPGTLAVLVAAGNQAPARILSTPGGDTLTTPYDSALLAPGTLMYHLYYGCADGCAPSPANALEVLGAEVTLEEHNPPTVAIDGRELLTVAPQSGLRSVSFTTNDAESGVARVSAVIGTTVVGTADFLDECEFAAFAACPQARSGSVAFDTRQLPDGLYPVSLRVTDAAGNYQTALAPTAIQVSNGAAGGNGATPELLRNARLTASFAANRRASLTVGYGHRIRIGGRLRAERGSPIRDAQLAVSVRPNSGGGPVRNEHVITSEDGTFSYAVARGPSRSLRFTYGGVSKRLTLHVTASATSRIGLSGTLVHYRGRVLSKPLPPKGKLVEIQGRAPGAGWTTFARRRTARAGSFSGTYRLRVRRPGVRLQFRVLVPGEARYPFVAHAGRAVSRTVR